MEETVLFSRVPHEGAAWAEITLNRPEKGNALTLPMLEQLSALARQVAADRDVRAVVLRGNGRFFCTGGDIAAWGAMTPHEMARDWIRPGIEVFAQIAALPQPVIAVLNGHALGGGLELALSADLRIALRTAKLGAPEVTLGMVSGWGGVRRLAETMGVGRARQLTLLGLPITAEQAQEWGLVNVVADDEAGLETQLGMWIAKFCANGPVAMALTKDLLATMHAGFGGHHMSAVAEAAGSEDCREGVRAFIEKRKPIYHNR